jgi:hypothetical protein
MLLTEEVLELSFFPNTKLKRHNESIPSGKISTRRNYLLCNRCTVVWAMISILASEEKDLSFFPNTQLKRRSECFKFKNC